MSKCLHLNNMKLKKINEHLAQRLQELGLNEPSPILKDSFGQIKSGNDVVIVFEDEEVREDLIVISVVQRLEKPFMLSPRGLVVVRDKEEVLRMHAKFVNYSKYTDLRIFLTHEKTDIDEDKNLISVGIDVLIGTPERLSEMFGVAGYDVNQLKMFVINNADDLMRKRYDTKLARLSEAIGKTQRLYVSSSEYERLDTFVDRTMLDSFWFTEDEYLEEEIEEDEMLESDDEVDTLENK